MAREEHDSITTVERLRGRLLAERMASRTAMAEADHMAERLGELEKQLEEEMEERGRAEKRLKHALKKLEFLTALNFPGRTDLPESSVSSSSPNKCFNFDERLGKWKDLGQCESSGSADSVSGSAQQRVSQDGSWISAGTESSRDKAESEGDEVSIINGCRRSVDGTLSEILGRKSD